MYVAIIFHCSSDVKPAFHEAIFIAPLSDFYRGISMARVNAVEFTATLI